MTAPVAEIPTEIGRSRGGLPWLVAFLARRFVWAVITLFLFISTLFFFVQAWVPFDFATQFGQGGQDTGVRESLGLNRSLVAQYLDYMGSLLRLDLGEAFSGGSVWEAIKAAAPVTIFIFVVGAVIAYAVGDALGRVAAWSRLGAVRTFLTTVGVVAATAFPPFLVFLVAEWAAPTLLDIRSDLGLPTDSYRIWRDGAIDPTSVMTVLAVGFVLALTMALALRSYGRKYDIGWLPPLAVPVALGGAIAGVAFAGLGTPALDLMYRADYRFAVGTGSPLLVLIGVVLLTFGQVMFMTRVGIEDELSEDYALTARAKGLTERRVRDRHVARNALAPTLAATFLSFPTIIAGMAIIEEQLQVQGLSWLFFNRGFEFQDIPLMLGVLICLGIIGVAFRIVIDVSIAYLDPRQRTAEL